MSRFGAGRFVAVTAALLVLTVLAPSRGAAREIGPEANFCAEIKTLPRGEELVLRPGANRTGPLSVRGLVVRRNVVRDSLATMYFGCHDGATCTVTGLVVEGNFIQGVTAPDPQIGYGMEVKLNSAGIIRDNIVMNTKGPGIMVFGSSHLPSVSLVERNVAIGSRTSSGIVVGGEPAIARNSVTVSNEQAGIGLEDYKKRGLLRGVFVANNTVYKNRAGGITAGDRDLRRHDREQCGPRGWRHARISGAADGRSDGGQR